MKTSSTVQLWLFSVLTALQILATEAIPSQIKLVHDLLDKYDKKAKPVWDNALPINVSFSMDLYQILELNEPQQFILLNAWIIERWYDEFLYWDPEDYSNITELRLPHESIWLPDTTLYNSLVMKDDDTRRLLNAKLTTDRKRKAALIELLYPTIYKFSCLLNLRFFPFDAQVCTMTFSSWTYDQKGIDYFPYSEKIGTSNYLENEGWYIMSTKVVRNEVKYSCCPNKYTLLQLTLYLRRKPLFYLVNLIIPTSIITLIALVGFFTTSSASGMREEKVSLGITTLLSMSILMLMVSDQMPTTSTFIPLIGWFILAMIVVISLGTIASSVIIAVQKRGRMGERLGKKAMKLSKAFSYITCLPVPSHILKEDMMTEVFDSPSPSMNVKIDKLDKNKNKKSKKNGAALISDKSSEPLIHMSPSNTMDDTTVSVSTPAPMSPPANLTLEGADGVSMDVSLGSDGPSCPPSAKTPKTPGGKPNFFKLEATRLVNLAAKKNQNDITKKEKSAFMALYEEAQVSQANIRKYAIAEYEWVATIIERCCFAIFVTAFLFITVGINLIGFVHWYTKGLEFLA